LSGANGGEMRKSFHGVAPGHALIVESPTQLQVSPMQIDTWHREAMNISSGMWTPFVAGPLPTSSPARGWDALYSGLLECPVTTRITRAVDTDYVVQGSGSCTHPVTTAAECFAAAAAAVGGNVAVKNTTGSDATRPAGCSVTTSTSTPVVVALFNTLSTTTATCASGASVLEGTAASLINVTVRLDKHSGNATITLAGPADVWFGVGFNASRMPDFPWALVVEGSGDVTEHILGDHAAGSILAPSIAVLSSSVADGVRTAVVTRPLKGMTASYFSFDTSAPDATIRFISALGSGPAFAYHKTHSSSVISLLPLDAAAGACVCPQPRPFGEGTGTLTYINTGQKGDVGQGTSGFDKRGMCKPWPASDMLDQQNPTCDVRTYAGGQSSCLHMWSLLDANQTIPWPDQQLVLYHKYRFWVQPYNESYHQGLTRKDNWGLGSTIEFDVPKCAEGVPGCTRRADGLWVHTVRGAFFTDGTLGAVHFHCHAPTCLNMALYRCAMGTPLSHCNETTGELMCSQTPVYGDGSAKLYQEPGYIEIPPCVWGKAEHGLEPPPPLDNVPLFLIKTSNATVGHFGEMAAAQVYTYPTAQRR
jgi:hypothetical protein